MNIFLRISHLSIFKRLLAAFFIVFLPLYILVIQSYISGQKNVEKEIAETIAYQNASYLNNLESTVVRIVNIQTTIASDRKINFFSTLGDKITGYEWVDNIDSIQNKINIIKGSSELIEDVRIHLPLIDMSLDSQGKKSSLFSDELSKIHSTYSFPFLPIDDSLMIEYSTNEVYGNTGFYIVAEISKARIESSLKGIIAYNDGKAMLFDKDLAWIYSYPAISKEQAEFIVRNNLANIQFNNQPNIRIDGVDYLAVINHSAYLNASLVTFIPLKYVKSHISTYTTLIWVISIFAVVEIMGFASWIHRLINVPLSKMINVFKKVEKGDWDIQIKHRRNDEFQFLYKQFNSMFAKLKKLINQTYKQEILLKNTELKQLQNQINTHFLYNCFFTITRMIKLYDDENAAKLTNHLGSYYQFITKNSKTEIALYDEVSHAINYMEIQNLRFMGKIDYEIDEIPHELGGTKVPRLILQPLVENCYNHGLKNVTSEGKIVIKINTENSFLNISVDDNGKVDDNTIAEINNLLKSSDIIKDSALVNIHLRLQTRYGDSSGLEVMKNVFGGLRVNLKICLKEEIDNVQTFIGG